MQNGGNVLDKVLNVHELQGWRLARAEELQVIQGFFLKEAQKEKKIDRSTDVIFGFFAVLSLMGTIKISDFVLQTYAQNEITDTVLLILVAIGLALIAIFLIRTIITSSKKKTVEKYFDAISTNMLRVNDVEIVEVVSLRGIGSAATDGHRVKVKDMYGNYCEENIVFECCNGYQKTKALLIDITISKNEAGVISRKRVIPCKEYDPRLWSIGLNNYKRLVNKKEI